jgi:hypothetical protein
MKLDADTIVRVLQQVEALLHDPTVEVFSEIGVVRVRRPGRSFMEFRPDPTQRTVTIKTNGGARETDVWTDRSTRSEVDA